jgi:tRNA(Ser,Leu) C12 N-acetylase TAN1
MYQPGIKRAAGGYVKGNVLVTLKDGADVNAFKESLKDPYAALNVMERLGIVLVKCPEGKEKEACEELKSLPGVWHVDTNGICHTMGALGSKPAVA